MTRRTKWTVLGAIALAVVPYALCTSYTDLPHGLLLLLMPIGLLLLWLGTVNNCLFHERGHFLTSFLPWIQIGLAYTFVFYVRIGFGSWPRTYLDDPKLPLIGLDGFVLLASILTLTLLPVLWAGWLFIRWRKGFRGRWVASTVIFASGILVLLALHWFDPWKFWDWVLD